MSEPTEEDIALFWAIRNGSSTISPITVAAHVARATDALRQQLAASEQARAKVADENYNLTTLIGRLCHAFSAYAPANPIIAQARDYLRRINNMGSPLREPAPASAQPERREEPTPPAVSAERGQA